MQSEVDVNGLRFETAEKRIFETGCSRYRLRCYEPCATVLAGKSACAKRETLTTCADVNIVR